MGVSAVFAFLLLLLALYLVSRPLVLPAAAARANTDESEALDGQKDRLLDAIRELDMDHATGKLSDADYQELRSRYKAEAALVMKEIKASAPVPAASDASASLPAAVSTDGEIHAEGIRAVSFDVRPDDETAGGFGNGNSAHADTHAAANGETERPTLSDEIERMIAAKKSSLEGPACPSCGADRAADDRFCRSCGAQLHSSTSHGDAPEGSHD